MEKHVQIVGLLWIFMGILGIVLAVLAFGLFFGLSFIPDMDPSGQTALRIVGMVAGVFFGVIALPSILGGIGVLKRQEWARILVIILAILNLLQFPLGTALAIYSLVVLFNAETTAWFRTTP